MNVTRKAIVVALTACVASTAARISAGQGTPDPEAVADSQAVAATHRSRTLAALFEEFRTTTPENARINSRAIAVLAVCLATAGPAAADASATQASDEDAIRAIVRSYVNARELRDPAAIEAIFTADADQHTTSGEWRRGRAELIRGTMESSKRNPGRRSITVETVRFVTPDVAIADGPYEISTDGNVRRMWATIVLRRQGAAWRIAAIRNMAPTASTAGPPR